MSRLAQIKPVKKPPENANGGTNTTPYHVFYGNISEPDGSPARRRRLQLGPG